MKQHRLVILGSMDEFVELVREAKRQGIYTIVCDGYRDGPGKQIADKSYDINIRDVEAVAAMCKEEEADGIVTSFSDIMFEYLVKIAHCAGLPCYLKPQQLPYLREKSQMKQMFHQLGIHTPRSIRISPDFQDEEIASLRLPLVIKPINGYGSRGIFVVNSIQEVRDKFQQVAQYSTQTDILVEEYNDGHEFNMMNWVVNGKVHVLSIADREKTSPKNGDIPHVSRVTYPSRLTSKVYDEAREVVQKVADFLGMQEGPLSMQFFWDEVRGVEVCEITGRMFGYEHELLTYSSGFSPEKLWIMYAYDKAAMKEYVQNHTPFFTDITAGLYFHGREGTVCDLGNVSQMCQLPHVKESVIFYNQGDTVSHQVGAKPYFTRIYLSAEEYAQLDQETAYIFENIYSHDAQGNNLILHNEVTKY